jgi:hypothetical protein
VPEIEGRINAIDEEKSSIETGKAESDAKMEELTLRQAIGELTDDEVESLGAELRGTLDEANGRLDGLNGERDEFATALARWVELAAEGNQNDGTTAAEPEPEPEPEFEPEPEPEIVVEEEVVVDDGAGDFIDDIVVDDEPAGGPTSGQHASTTSYKEDLSAVFEDGTEGVEPIESDEGADDAIEAGDDYGIEAGEDDGEVELNLDGGAAAGEDTGDEIGIDLDVGIGGGGDEEAAVEEEEEAGGSDEDRRAILLYSEGSPEEQIYPFPGDVLSIGRGRDNDIQIKNDSKVSRFHCRLFRRGGKFYIEDNKSSNGTLVNGELITERLLFGGEEVIIGETFFRFRIMN